MGPCLPQRMCVPVTHLGPEDSAPGRVHSREDPCEPTLTWPLCSSVSPIYLHSHGAALVRPPASLQAV